MPQTEQELLEALTCVLEALEVKKLETFGNWTDGLQQVLHQTPLFHRDISWPNIVRRLDDPHELFLIDWEDAAAPPTKAQRHLAAENHSPCIFIDGHGAEVDLWGVGQLIIQSRAEGVPFELRALGKWMQDPAAPSAQEALDKIKAYQSSDQFPYDVRSQQSN